MRLNKLEKFKITYDIKTLGVIMSRFQYAKSEDDAMYKFKQSSPYYQVLKVEKA